MKGISLFQGVFFGVLIVCALIGLFVFATYSNTGGAAAVGTVTIWGTLPQSEMDTTLAESVKADSTLKGVKYVEKPEASLANDLAAAIATGQGPDLVIASQEDLLSLESFLTPIALASLSARTFASTFAPGAAVFTAPSGKGYWGIPLAIDPMVLFYNRSILSSTGVATPPATWEALTGLVPKVATLTPTKQITRGLVALGTYSNVHDARGILSTLFLQTSVPIMSVNTNGSPTPDLGLSSSGASAGAPGESVIRFYTQFADPNELSYTWNASLPDSEQAFQNGDLALYLGFISEARYLKSANPNLAFDVAPIPQPATAPTKATYGLIYAAMIPRGAGNAAGAYKAAALLAGDPEQVAIAAATGLAPATASALGNPPSGDAIAETADASALYTEGWLSPAPASTDQVFSAMINAVVTGSLSIQEALTTAERSLGALLQP